MLDNGLDETSTFTKVDPKTAVANRTATRSSAGNRPVRIFRDNLPATRVVVVVDADEATF